MSRYRVTKSPFRQFLLGLAGIVLVLAAMDILWLHNVSSEPLVNDAGEITTRGQAWRRTDLIWGSLFLISGAGLFGAAAIGLASGRAVAEITDAGLELRVGGPHKTVTFAWADLVAVRSVLAAGDGLHPRPVLVVEVSDPSRYPPELWGGEWIDSAFHADADGWSESPDDLAVRMEIGLEQWRLRGVTEEPISALDAADPAGEGDPMPDTSDS